MPRPYPLPVTRTPSPHCGDPPSPPGPLWLPRTSYLPPCYDFCYCLALKTKKKKTASHLSVSVGSAIAAVPSRPITPRLFRSGPALSRSLSTVSRHQVCALVFLIGQTLITKAKASRPGPSLSGPCQPSQPPRLSRSHTPSPSRSGLGHSIVIDSVFVVIFRL